MFGDEGYTTLFRLRGMPVRLHWSFALGMLIFGGLRFAPGIWLGYFVLIAAHELGHGFLAQRYGHQVRSLDIHGFGGLCSYAGQPSALHRSIIAWGGVLAQLLLFGAVHLAMWSLGPPSSEFTADLVHIFTRINLFIAALNLLPLNGFDGAQAWRLPKLWWRAGRGRSGAPASSDLAAGFRDKLRNRAPGDFAKDSPADSASVVRIERGPDGSVRVVAVESDEKDPADYH